MVGRLRNAISQKRKENPSFFYTGGTSIEISGIFPLFTCFRFLTVYTKLNKA